MIGVGIIGAGQIALANHLPGLRLCPEAKVVAVCDANARTLAEAQRVTEAPIASSNYHDLLQRDDVQAVIVATPNDVHEEIVVAAARAQKHILCEKPLALNYAGARKMMHEAIKANTRHMTAFTYRFVPAMRYLKHLVDSGAFGEIRHFRAQRFQDWGRRPLGWRQLKTKAGTGELGDMLSHRIDYGHYLVGPFSRIVAKLKTLVHERGNQPADADDWVAFLGEFETGATGVLESTKLATGRGEGHRGLDLVEINGSEASAVYTTQKPLELMFGKEGAPELERMEVPREFWVYPASPRDPAEGNPLATFRYDQDVEFVQAILEQRDCMPSFVEGAACQRVMDACVVSSDQDRWVKVADIS
ncbi:MAG TPA: Gfo/Idh/MocA family oxidoreductase [Tepidisphaeraceae bacterium]